MIRDLALPLLLLALVAGGCSAPPAGGWERIHNAGGRNACDSPVGKALPLTGFEVGHDRIVAEVTLTLTAGWVDFELESPYGVAYRHRFTGSGREAATIEDPASGPWHARIVCPAVASFNLEWRITVDGFVEPPARPEPQA